MTPASTTLDKAERLLLLAWLELLSLMAAAAVLLLWLMALMALRLLLFLRSGMRRNEDDRVIVAFPAKKQNIALEAPMRHYQSTLLQKLRCLMSIIAF